MSDSASEFFREVGMADADDVAVKLQAVVLVAEGVLDRGQTQAEFGREIGWRQPAVSALLRGEVDLFGWNRINAALKPFGHKIVTRHEMVAI